MDEIRIRRATGAAGILAELGTSETIPALLLYSAFATGIATLRRRPTMTGDGQPAVVQSPCHQPQP
jgi:hypothetical protein